MSNACDEQQEDTVPLRTRQPQGERGTVEPVERLDEAPDGVQGGGR